MTDKRYTVISAPSPSGPEYRIYDRVNECSISGGFDTQKWAEAVAEMMESRWKDDNKAGSRMDVTARNHGRHTRPHDKGGSKNIN